jgi:peptidoglycan-associated lipoprotein
MNPPAFVPVVHRRKPSGWMGRLALLLATGLLAACGSSVKLDTDVPVSDSTGTPVQPAAPAQGGQGSASGVDSRTVTGVQTDASRATDPPQSLARVVYFDYDDFAVKSEFTALLEGHARFLRANPQRRVGLEGHTDDRGGREYNLALGQKRAEAVRRALSILGVNDAQMEAVSFGKEKPAQVGDDESAYRLNRRVELIYR